MIAWILAASYPPAFAELKAVVAGVGQDAEARVREAEEDQERAEGDAAALRSELTAARSGGGATGAGSGGRSTEDAQQIQDLLLQVQVCGAKHRRWCFDVLMRTRSSSTTPSVRGPTVWVPIDCVRAPEDTICRVSAVVTVKVSDVRADLCVRRRSSAQRPCRPTYPA